MATLKTNKVLFDQWKSLGYKVQNMNSIVQNTIDIPDDELVKGLEEWLTNAESVKAELQSLIEQTAIFVATGK